jgi:LPXTG-motif cell wall-anchored protein
MKGNTTMRNLLLAGAVALALLLAPAAAANAETPEGYVPADGIHGTIDRAVVAPGERVTYTAPAGRFAAAQEVTASARGISGASIALVSTVSDRTWSMTAKDDGSLTFTIRMPMDGRGGYSLKVAGSGGTPSDTFTITVVPVGASDAPAAPRSARDGLASTGSTIAVYAISGVALLLVVAGVVLLIVRRRRSTPDRSA